MNSNKIRQKMQEIFIEICDSTDEVNRLTKENSELKRENKFLRAREKELVYKALKHE